MNTARLNITLPEDAVKILSDVRNKSAYIAEAIRQKKMIEEKEKLKKKLESAYKLAAQEDYETYKDWEDTIQDGLEDDTR
ncbi:MAG: hypothetical protein L6246_07385 [Thermodesulfovibrionales bacterium]|jgi:hypothetical protein|nr:hypothetical protein [Thermodesulfovibrionales bacterium]